MTPDDPQTGQAVTTQEVELHRYYFVLPEPVSIPDGYQHVALVSNDPATPADDDPEVSIVFHQVDAPGGRMQATHMALTQVLAASPGIPAPANDVSPLKIDSEFTVVEAVTPAESPDTVPETDASHPVRWLPRADPFTRCVALTDRVLRAYRQATEHPYGPLTYVRIPSPVAMFRANGLRETVNIDGLPVVLTRPLGEWEPGLLIMLDHTNAPDPFRHGEPTPEVQQRFEHWWTEAERGNPVTLWRERIIEARRALHITGELAQAVLLANTSAETMLDTILALLTWEEGSNPEDLTDTFEEGKVLRRITTEYPARLKGNWTTNNGPVGNWYTSAYRLRHRVIHAGYTPTPYEAETAIQAAFELQRFVMDRIATQRNVYPRSALMALGQQGLINRSLWAGKIRAFAENEATQEPDWRDSFTDYYRNLVTALAPK